MWLFHLHRTVNIQAFSPVFPLAESAAKAFGWLFLWSFKEKASAIFYGTAIAFQGPEGDKGRRARRKPENMAKSILIPLPKKRSYARKTSAPLSGACLPFSITHYPPYINQRLMRLCRVIPSCRSAGLITSGDTPGELPFTPKTSIGTYAEEESCHGGGSGRRNDEPY